MAKARKNFLIRFTLWLNFLFVALLLLAYIAPFVPPTILWIFVILGIIYPALLLVNILFVLFWIILLNKNFLYSFIAILVGFNTIQTHFQFNNQSSEPTDETVKIVSFNVKNLSNNNEKYADKEVRLAIQNYLDNQNANIICLQEFQTYPTKGVNTIKDFQGQLQKPYFAATPYLEKSRFKFVDLLLILSDFPILHTEELRHHGKIFALIADIKYHEDTLRVYNLHLESNHFGKNEYEIFYSPETTIDEQTTTQINSLVGKLARYSKIRNIQVNQVLENIAKSPYPMLICGDFNDTPGTYTYHKLAAGRTDAFVEKGKGYGNTYNGKLPAMRIDFILNDTIFKVNSFEIGHFEKSDHFPIMSTIKMSFK
ncbi:MAG TPA: hypothetical protein DCG69_12845 [Bacteroidales bacterium]|nr:hypothetical protein [Bacteroidales bacterium]